MIVKELIERLQAFPQDAIVIYEFHSDYAAMDAEERLNWSRLKAKKS